MEAQTAISKTRKRFRTECKALVAIFKKEAAKYATSKSLRESLPRYDVIRQTI